MTHFFFSLIREQNDKMRSMSLTIFFDTPIITQVTLNVRHTFFDKISAIGGTLGLFCGVSVISILELVYYTILFLKRITSQREETSEKLSLNINSNNRFD